MVKALLVVGVTAAALGGASSVGASSAGASCPPVSGAQLRSIVGLAGSETVRDTVADSGEAVHRICGAVAWTGPVPTSLQAAFAMARSGHGAQVGIESWTPNDGNPSADEWPDDYDVLTGGFDIEGVTFPGLFTNGGWPTKHVQPAALGYQTTGLVVTPQGQAKGLRAAIGCWWNDDAFSAVCLLDEEALAKPVLKHLNQLAKIAVPTVLG
jgi:hypothetical protein